MTDIGNKKQLRQFFSAVRKAKKSYEKDAAIAERLLSDELIRNADIVLMYASFGSEIDTWNIAETLLGRRIILAYPLCGDNSVMTFHTISSLGQLENGKYGIREPDISLPCPALSEQSVCILPGLAFTKDGGRLGYGGGFYDRFLAANNIHKIALSYERLVVPELPLLQHDIKTDIIITEERTVHCHA